MRMFILIFKHNLYSLNICDSKKNKNKEIERNLFDKNVGV